MNKYLILISLILLSGCVYDSDDLKSDSSDSLDNRIYIQLDEKRFQELLDDPNNQSLEMDVLCTIDSITVNAELKIHGGYSRNYPKKSFRLKFDKRVPADLIYDSRFLKDPSLTVKSVILNAAAIDFSRSRNAIAMYCTKLAGGATPQIGFHSVAINGGYYGLYSTIERIDEDFIEQYYPHKTYDLLKAQYWGASLFHGDNDFELKYGKSKYINELSEDLTDDDDMDYEDLLEIVNMESILSFVCGNLISDESDGYGKNYYFFYEHLTEKVSLFRWDADASLGRGWSGYTKEPDSIKLGMSRNALLSSLSKEKKWRKLLRDNAKKLFKSGIIDSLVDLSYSLQDELSTQIIRDYELWNEQLITHYNTVEDQWGSNWDLNLSHEEMIASQFDEIRAFLLQRETAFMAELDAFVDELEDNDNENEDRDNENKDDDD